MSTPVTWLIARLRAVGRRKAPPLVSTPAVPATPLTAELTRQRLWVLYTALAMPISEIEEVAGWPKTDVVRAAREWKLHREELSQRPVAGSLLLLGYTRQLNLMEWLECGRTEQHDYLRGRIRQGLRLGTISLAQIDQLPDLEETTRIHDVDDEEEREERERRRARNARTRCAPTSSEADDHACAVG